MSKPREERSIDSLGEGRGYAIRGRSPVPASTNRDGRSVTATEGLRRNVAMQQMIDAAVGAGYPVLVLDPRGDSMKIEPIAGEEIETYIYGLRSESTGTDGGQEEAHAREDEHEGSGERSDGE